MNKRGMTLMELLVYMAIVGIVVMVAGTAFTNSTKMRIRTEGQLKSNAVAEELGALVRQDLSQMGAKSALTNATGSTASFEYYAGVFMDPGNTTEDSKDSSSYNLTVRNDFDSLTLRRVRYDDDGSYSGVEEISWYGENGDLKRRCKTIEGTAVEDLCPSEGDGNVVVISEDVTRFKVVPGLSSIAGGNLRMLPEGSDEFKMVVRSGVENLYNLLISPSEGGSSVTLSGFAANYDFEQQLPRTDGKNANQVFVAKKSNEAFDAWNSACSKVTLEPLVEYEISFKIPYSEDASRMFVAGRDYASVGFRKTEDGKRPAGLDDFLFYPPISTDASSLERSFRFMVSEKIEDVCLGFTFASYSPVVANGSISLKDIRLNKVASSNYVFGNADLSPKLKKLVKAMAISLTVEMNGEASNIEVTAPVPSNGPRD